MSGDDYTIKLASVIDAEEILRARGFEKHECERCNGTGFFFRAQYPSERVDEECIRCDGRGWSWLPKQ